MSEVSIRELRNRGGAVVDRAASGERIVITRANRPVAELRPVAPGALAAEVLIERRRGVPYVDPGALRLDIDRVLDAGL